MFIQIVDSYVHTDFRCTSSSSSSYTPNEARASPETKYSSKTTLTKATSTIGVRFHGKKKSAEEMKN